MKWLLILLGLSANAAASILVKVASRGDPAANPILTLLNPLMILAVASYGLAFVLYSVALTRLPLNVAHPIMTAGAIVLVGLSSIFIFKEPVPLAVALGYAMLLGGIVLLSTGVQR